MLLYHILREERFHTVDSVDTLCGFNLIRVQHERYVIFYNSLVHSSYAVVRSKNVQNVNFHKNKFKTLHGDEC